MLENGFCESAPHDWELHPHKTSLMSFWLNIGSHDDVFCVLCV